MPKIFVCCCVCFCMVDTMNVIRGDRQWFIYCMHCECKTDECCYHRLGKYRLKHSSIYFCTAYYVCWILKALMANIFSIFVCQLNLCMLSLSLSLLLPFYFSFLVYVYAYIFLDLWISLWIICLTENENGRRILS